MQSQILPVNFGLSQPGMPGSISPLSGHDIWLNEHLQDFAERMATHGMAVSCVRLRNDAAYTLRQLAKGHVMDDEVLRDMAVTLLCQFERSRPRISSQLNG